MLATVVDVLVSPRGFFAERDEPRLAWPALVVATSAVVLGLAGVVIVSQFRALVPADEYRTALTALVPLLVAVGLASWLAVAGVVYAASYPMRGRGGGRALLAYVGWGWLPQVLGALVLAASALVAVSQIQAPTDEATALAFARQMAWGQLIAVASGAGTARATATGSYSQVQIATKLVTTLWSGYVWVAAAREARDLTRRQALLVVAVPVLAMLIS